MDPQEHVDEDTRSLRALIDNLGVGVFSIDNRTGRVVEANAAYARILGFRTAQDAIGASVLDHYDDPKERAETFARLLAGERRRKTGFVRFEAVRMRQDNGEPVNVLITVSLVRDASGEVTHLDGTIEDIGGRQRAEKAFAESERRFRHLFENAGFGMVITAPDGLVTRVNRAFCDFLGWEETEVAGVRFEAFLHDADAPESAGWFGGGCADESSPTRAWRFRHRSGETVWGMVTLTTLRAEDGVVLSTVLSIQNVTKLKRMELELQRAQRLESLGLLAGGIAHDFNNSLAVILGSLDLARRDRREDDELIASAMQAAERASTLTARLMVFAKGGHPIKQAASIDTVLREAVDRCASDGGVSPVIEIEPDIPDVEVDIARMAQVLASILCNAAQAMAGSGPAKVRVSAVWLDGDTAVPLPEGHYVRIDIADKGVGIPAEDLPHIFDPFFSRADGTGLSLSTAHAVIARHGGHISVDSTVGVGSTFTIHLKIAEPQRLTPTATDVATRPSRRGRVLVMDDEPGVRKTAAAMIRTCGFEADVASDGAAAVAEFEKAAREGRHYAAVILDLTVPGGLGGAEIIGQLLDIDPDVRAIVSSGYSTSPVLAAHRTHGFLGVLPKPYSLAKLRSTLLHAIGFDGDGSESETQP